MADRIPGKTNSFSTFIPYNNSSQNLSFSFQFEAESSEFDVSDNSHRSKGIYLQSTKIQFLHNQKSVWFHQLLKLSTGIVAIGIMATIGLFISKTSHSISSSLITLHLDENIEIAPETEIVELEKPSQKNTAIPVISPPEPPEKAEKTIVKSKLVIQSVDHKKPVDTAPKEKISFVEEPLVTRSKTLEATVKSILPELLDDLAQAKKTARSEGKYVFVKFGANWCIPCKLMDETVLNDQRILNFFKTSYSFVNMDIEDFDAYTYKKRYKIKELPTLLIFNSRGQLIGRQNGAIGTSRLIDLLESHQPVMNQDDYVETTLKISK